jgi:hypothetical protein
VVTICNSARDVQLTGIVVRQARPGWVVLDLPPEESWQPQLACLSAQQRERIESPDFYQLLQYHITQRFLWPSGG